MEEGGESEVKRFFSVIAAAVSGNSQVSFVLKELRGVGMGEGLGLACEPAGGIGQPALA